MDHATESRQPPATDLAGNASAASILRLDQPLWHRTVSPATLEELTFALKDNIDTEELPTTAACPAFAYIAPTNATFVDRLLDADAALAGKTNPDQFACGLGGMRSPCGAMPNAFDARYVSGGSSAGSACVVATGQVDFELGTDMAGSGRVPVGFNNIVGIKPSEGLLGTRGVVPAARSVDGVSIPARDLPTAVRVLEAAAAHDPQDAYSRRLTLACTPFPARFSFGVPARPEFFGDALAAAAFGAAVRELEALGDEVVRINFAPLPAPTPILPESAPATTPPIAVVGAHLRGLLLNHQLTEQGARLALTTRTAPHYRLYALANTVPAKPGLVRVSGAGAAVALWGVAGAARERRPAAGAGLCTAGDRQRRSRGRHLGAWLSLRADCARWCKPFAAFHS